MLTDLGHDVLSGLERDPHATDEALLALTNDEQRVLITEDTALVNWSLCVAYDIRASYASLTCRLRKR